MENKMTLIDNNVRTKKMELLEYYRSRSDELIAESKQIYADSEYKKRASLVNKGLIEAKGNLLKILEQKSKKEGWKKDEVLEGVLIITYTNYVVMLEARNDVWSYEYMAFARRIGELWEPFCLLCWDHPINDNLNYFVPPLFKDVKTKLTKEIDDLISKLEISKDEKDELKKYYQKVWILVTSGEIKLELDLHFENGENNFVVDFKSGFSSNEKGNTNRLLLVASIYKVLEEGHKCLLFVRSPEEQNNHYLQTLKKSGLWDVYCGKETYRKIQDFTGFNLAEWMKENVKWEDDFDEKMFSHLKENNLIQYLEW
jgi:hypothetical protein